MREIGSLHDRRAKYHLDLLRWLIVRRLVFLLALELCCLFHRLCLLFSFVTFFCRFCAIFVPRIRLDWTSLSGFNR